MCSPVFSFKQEGNRSPQCQILKDMWCSGSCTFQDSLQTEVCVTVLHCLHKEPGLDRSRRSVLVPSPDHL